MASTKFFAPHGPYGRQGPSTFSFVFDKTDRIGTFTVSFGDIVDGIGFEIVDESGTSKSLWYGGHAHQNVSVRLQDSEYITQISGSYGDYDGDGDLTMTVAQIYIHTNLVPDGYGPYGWLNSCKNIKSFKSPDPSAGSIVGFFGISERYLNSIGVFLNTDS